MGSTAEIIEFDQLEHWQRRIGQTRADVETILKRASDCFEFQKKIKNIYVSEQYAAFLLQWEGMERKDAVKWARLGGNVAKLRNAVDLSSLPPRMETLYILSLLPDEVIKERVTATTTLSAARALRKQYAPPKPRKVTPIQSKHEELQKRQQKLLDAAIKVERERLHEQWQQAVDERVAGINAAILKQEAAVKERQAQLDAARASLESYMTKEEFQLVINCLHPDRAPEDRRDRFGQAFVICKRLESMVNHNLPLKVLRERGWAK